MTWIGVVFCSNHISGTVPNKSIRYSVLHSWYMNAQISSARVPLFIGCCSMRYQGRSEGGRLASSLGVAALRGGGGGRGAGRGNGKILNGHTFVNTVTLLGWSIYITWNPVYLIWTFCATDCVYVKCSIGIACQRLISTVVVCWESPSGRNRLG